MVCLDSSFIIDVLKGRNTIEDLEKQLDGGEPDIKLPPSAIIEITRGIHLEIARGNLSKMEKEKTFEFLSSFSVLDLDRDSAIKAGEIEAELTNRGKIIDIKDIMIAAVFITNEEKLITKNLKHFERIPFLKVQGY